MPLYMVGKFVESEVKNFPDLGMLLMHLLNHPADKPNYEEIAWKIRKAHELTIPGGGSVFIE